MMHVIPAHQITLCAGLQDGIDPTRREDYLSDEEFAKVFGMAR